MTTTLSASPAERAEAIASDLQRRKVSGVFRSMDANKDGFLEKADFEALTARWVRIRDGAGEARLTAIMMGWWDALSGASDLNLDNRVTLDEVLLVVDRLGEMTDVVAGTARAMFEAIDENADGKISAAEYHQLIEAWAGEPTYTDEIFPLLDLDGDGYLSSDEFAELWTEFWAGDNATAPGALVFGRF